MELQSALIDFSKFMSAFDTVFKGYAQKIADIRDSIGTNAGNEPQPVVEDESHSGVTPTEVAVEDESHSGVTPTEIAVEDESHSGVTPTEIAVEDETHSGVTPTEVLIENVPVSNGGGLVSDEATIDTFFTVVGDEVIVHPAGQPVPDNVYICDTLPPQEILVTFGDELVTNETVNLVGAPVEHDVLSI